MSISQKASSNLLLLSPCTCKPIVMDAVVSFGISKSNKKELRVMATPYHLHIL